MKEITERKLNENLTQILENAALGEEIYKVQTNHGKVVIISDDEWDILTGVFKECCKRVD